MPRAPGNARCWRSPGVCWSRSACPKLLFAWTVSLLLPAVLLGLSAAGGDGLDSPRRRSTLRALTGIGAALVLVAVAALGWFGWRPLLRSAESQLLVAQRAGRPARLRALAARRLRHLAERLFGRYSAAGGRGQGCGRRAPPGRASCVCGCAAVAVAILDLAGLALGREPWPTSCMLHRLDRADAWPVPVALVSGLSRIRVAGLGFRGCQHGSAARSRRVRRGIAPGGSDMARRASVGFARRRRALWLSHRERTRWPARQPALSRG